MHPGVDNPIARASGHAWRADIDGLRAVAVLSVLGFHAFPSWLSGGFMGVDVFFVISGFLITGLVLADLEARRHSIAAFYARRARRLFPALAVVLTTTVLAAAVFTTTKTIALTAKHSAAGALSIVNLLLWRESGYFDVASQTKPLLHLWSLGVEEQFYLVWPLLLVAAHRNPRRWLPVLAVMAAASFATAEWLNERSHNAAFYLPFSRFWELGSGAAVAMLAARGITPDRVGGAWVARGAAGLGLLLVFSALALLDPEKPFPGTWALPPVMGAALVMWSGAKALQNTGSSFNLLRWTPVVYVGRISYPLYLWHWPLLALPAAIGMPHSVVTTAALLVAAVVLAAATEHWIEQPIRLDTHRGRSLKRACGLLLAAVLVSLVIGIQQMVIQASPAAQQLRAELAWPDGFKERQGCPEALQHGDPALAFCRSSRPTPATAVVWGDSHADHLYPGLAQADPTRSWLLLGHVSCPPTTGVEVLVNERDCAARSERALGWIERQPHVTLVVMGLFGHYDAADNQAFDHVQNRLGPAQAQVDGHLDPPTKHRLLQQGLTRAVDRLVQAGKTVLLVLDGPELPFDPNACYEVPRVALHTPQCTVSRAAITARRLEHQAMLQAIRARHPDRVTILDPLPVLCDDKACSAGTAQKPLYRDSHHLSLRGSALLASQWIQKTRLTLPPNQTAHR